MANTLPQQITFRGMLFMFQGTGGGCTCYAHTAVDGSGYVITCVDDPSAPSIGEPAMISHYSDIWDAATLCGDVEIISTFSVERA